MLRIPKLDLVDEQLNPFASAIADWSPRRGGDPIHGIEAFGRLANAGGRPIGMAPSGEAKRRVHGVSSAHTGLRARKARSRLVHEPLRSRRIGKDLFVSPLDLHEQIRDRARDFAENVIRPQVEKLDEEGGEVEFLLLGSGSDIVARSSAAHGRVSVADDPRLEHPMADRYSAVIAHHVKEHGFDMVVAVATGWAKDIVGRAADMLGGAMVSDVVGHEYVTLSEGFVHRGKGYCCAVGGSA